MRVALYIQWQMLPLSILEGEMYSEWRGWEEGNFSVHDENL